MAARGPRTTRERAKALAEQVRQGTDPLAAQRDTIAAQDKAAVAAKEQERRTRELAFDAYVTRFLEHGIRPGARDRTRSDYAGILRTHVAPLLNWAVSRGDIAKSPMEGMATPAAAKAATGCCPMQSWRLCWRRRGACLQPAPPPARAAQTYSLGNVAAGALAQIRRHCGQVGGIDGRVGDRAVEPSPDGPAAHRAFAIRPAGHLAQPAPPHAPDGHGELGMNKEMHMRPLRPVAIIILANPCPMDAPAA
jgi:hypothetical protein